MTNEERARELWYGLRHGDLSEGDVAAALDEAEKRGAAEESAKPHICIDALRRENATLKARLEHEKKTFE